MKAINMFSGFFSFSKQNEYEVYFLTGNVLTFSMLSGYKFSIHDNEWFRKSLYAEDFIIICSELYPCMQINGFYSRKQNTRNWKPSFFLLYSVSISISLRTVEWKSHRIHCCKAHNATGFCLTTRHCSIISKINE